MNSTGKRIKIARETAGLTQDAFAVLMGKSSKATVSSWETDKNEPTVSDFKKMAAILKTSVSYLIGESDTHEERPDMMYVSKDEFIELQRIALRKEQEAKKDLEDKVRELEKR